MSNDILEVCAHVALGQLSDRKWSVGEPFRPSSPQVGGFTQEPRGSNHLQHDKYRASNSGSWQSVRTMAARLPLTALDHLPPPNYAHVLLCCSLRTSPEEAFKILQYGLHRTFVQFPWLSGKVYPAASSPDRLEIRYEPVIRNDDCSQLKFNQLDSSWSWDELQETAFSLSFCDDETLSWAPFLPDITNGTDVMVAQANFMPGGCIIAVALCHAASDGTALGNVVQIWADNCRVVQEGAQQPINLLAREVSDRGLLEHAWREDGTDRTLEDIKPHTWRLLNLDAPSERVNSSPRAEPTRNSGEMSPYIFYISPANVTALRKECQKGPSGDATSVNDGISALIWRALLKSRTKAGEGPEGNCDPAMTARLDLPFDARPYLSQWIPPNYLGNCTLVNQAMLPLDQLVAPSASIGSVAHTIRQAVHEVSTTEVLDAYTLARLLQGKGTGITLDNLKPDGNGLMITSLLAVPMAEVSFGDALFGHSGKPEAIRMLMGVISKVFRYCIVLPRKSHGGVEFMANMSDTELDLLMGDEEFNTYVMHVA